jgi:hypothetical protein
MKDGLWILGCLLMEKSRVESCQNIRLGMIGTQQYQEGFKAPYRGLPLKPPPLAVVVD